MKHVLNALAFYQRVGLLRWHGYSNDATTRRAINYLNKKGFLELNEFNQARLIKEYIDN